MSLRNLLGDSEMNGAGRGLVMWVNYKIIYWFNPFLTGLKKKKMEPPLLVLHISFCPAFDLKAQKYKTTVSQIPAVESFAFMSFFHSFCKSRKKWTLCIVCSWNINPNFALIFILTVISL